jgi:HPt (histidine-containing phosphotransfer) domain-containing protein
MPESATGLATGITTPATFSSLPNPPGFELDLALRRLENNRKLYAMLAHSFRAEQGQDVTIARAALARGERTTAIRTLHTLKGVAATLGATALSALAKETELAFKDEAIPEAELNLRLDRLESNLQAACAALEDIAAALAAPGP